MTMKYTAEHEWIQLEDHEYALVGITLHAQDALGDIVFVELPEVGRTYQKGEQAGVVESVKAAADIYMPVTGEVTEVNEALRGEPAIANKDPMGNGWFFKLLIKDMAEFDVLMDEPDYAKFVKENS
ncbi:glycine cleavage system protein GcvH [Ramlibacter sp.]|uniref:glycine cleavage system protein GcvH n=1 Tax=Ramlibacter sp. TaxID=1917967 RepID=UPI003D0D358D